MARHLPKFWSAVSGPYNEFCLGATQSGGGTISLFNRNGATGNINFAVNGSPQNVGIVAAPPNSVQYNLAGSLAGVLLGDAQLLVGQSGAPLAKTMSGDATFSDLGALTLNNNISHLTGVGTLTSGATGSGFTVNFAATP